MQIQNLFIFFVTKGGYFKERKTYIDLQQLLKLWVKQNFENFVDTMSIKIIIYPPMYI